MQAVFLAYRVPGHEGAVGRLSGRAHAVDRLPHAALGIHEPLCPLPHHERDTRALRDATALREDLDDAVRRFGSIQRRCSGTSDDLDSFDHVRVDVVETGRDARPEPLDDDARRDVVGDADTVDVNERLIAEREAVHASDSDARTGADLSRPRYHHDARRPAIDQAGDVRRRGQVLNRRGLDRRRRISHGAPLLIAGGSGDDDLLEVDRLLLQGDANVRVTDAYRLRHRPIAQGGDAQGDL